MSWRSIEIPQRRSVRKLSMVRCQSALFVLISGCLLAACGGDSSSGGSESGGGGQGGGQTPGQVVVLRGGERMAWDQVAPSVQVARSYTYRLFIDGVQSAMTSVRCDDVRTSAGYECSGLLPAMSVGQHSLEVAAITGATQSASSAPLLVRVGIGSSTGGALQTSTTEMGLSNNPGGCIATASTVCYDAIMIASGLGKVAEVAWVPGDRAFFIENGDRILEIRADGVTPRAALDRESADSRLVSLVPAQDFDRTHLVYVGWSEPASGGQEVFRITRYREVQGIFGEGATIVANLPIPAQAHVPIGVDDHGLVYVALPASSNGPDGSGSVLRFEPSGVVPSTNPLSSPVVASGYAAPSGLAWDVNNRQMWLAGSDPGMAGSLVILPISANGRVGQLTIPMLGLSGPNNDAGASLPAISISATGQRDSRLWLVQQPGDVYRGVSRPGSSTLVRMPMDALGIAQTISESPTGRVLVVTGPTATTNGTSIWQLVPSQVAKVAQ